MVCFSANLPLQRSSQWRERDFPDDVTRLQGTGTGDQVNQKSSLAVPRRADGFEIALE